MWVVGHFQKMACYMLKRQAGITHVWMLALLCSVVVFGMVKPQISKGATFIVVERKIVAKVGFPFAAEHVFIDHSAPYVKPSVFSSENPLKLCFREKVINNSVNNEALTRMQNGIIKMPVSFIKSEGFGILAVQDSRCNSIADVFCRGIASINNLRIAAKLNFFVLIGRGSEIYRDISPHLFGQTFLHFLNQFDIGAHGSGDRLHCGGSLGRFCNGILHVGSAIFAPIFGIASQRISYIPEGTSSEKKEKSKPSNTKFTEIILAIEMLAPLFTWVVFSCGAFGFLVKSFVGDRLGSRGIELKFFLGCIVCTIANLFVGLTYFT